MRKFFVFAVSAAMALSLSVMSSAKTFVDVPSGHWAEDAVQKLSDKGLLEGYPDGTFKGDRQLTRYEYAMVVDRMIDMLDKTYCKKDACQVGPGPEGGPWVSIADFEEIKDIVKKLAAEFKDELAALKVKVDENSAKIKSLEDEVHTSRIGNVAVSGSLRQRIDAPSTDFPAGAATFYANYYQPLYNKTAAAAGVVGNTMEAGYEMVPALNISGKAGDNVTFALGMDKSIRMSSSGYGQMGATDEAGELVIDHAYVDVDFSPTVRELDKLSLRSGYQQFSFGPYGMLVDNAGVRSNAAVKVDVAKDIINFTGIGALAGTTPSASGFGSTAKDAYAAGRMGLNLSFANVGLNFLADGVGSEKGWGADVELPLLKKSPFLSGLKAEYMTVTDLQSGATPAAGAKDNSFIIGLDVYKNKRAGLTLSYADLPATVAYSSMDANPFTEYDSLCSAGLEVGPVANCYSAETGRNLFPAGFEGLGIQASYIVFNNVTLAGKGFIGNFAGNEGAFVDGQNYPGFGAVSVSKPINDKSSFRVEYAQQGRDFVSMNRVRGELLINF